MILLYYCLRHHLCCPWSMTWTWGRRAVWFTGWFGDKLFTEKHTRGNEILPRALTFHIYKIQTKVISPWSLSFWPFIYVLFCMRKVENTEAAPISSAEPQVNRKKNGAKVTRVQPEIWYCLDKFGNEPQHYHRDSSLACDSKRSLCF